MTPTEHPSKTSHGTGIFTLLGGLLRVKGTGASSASTLVLAALAVLALLPSIASANGGHAFGGTIGSGPGEGAGQLELVAPTYSDHSEAPRWRVAGSGVAVDDTSHDVYVADTGNHRIDEFTPEGQFVLAFGAGVDGLEDTCKLICTAGKSGSAPGELTAPRLLAVDGSSGDVYVGDGVGKKAADEVQYLEIKGATGGTYTLTFEGKKTGSIAYTNLETGPGADEYKGDDAKAALAALDELGGIDGNIEVEERINNNGEVLGLQVEFVGTLAEKAVRGFTADASELTPAGATINVIVEREGSQYVGEVISKFTESGSLIGTWGNGGPGETANGQLVGKTAEPAGCPKTVGEPCSPAVPFGGALEGIAVDSAGDLWVLDEGDLYEFEEDGKTKASTQHIAEGASASGLAVDAAGNPYAVENGCVEKLGSGCISAKHEPSPTGFAFDEATGHVFVGLGSSIENADSSCVPTENCEVFGGAGGSSLQGGAGVAVDASTNDPPLSGTVYAANTVAGQVDVFPVVFDVESKPASEVGLSSMTLNGTVDPEGSELSECYFEYGTSSEYEHSAPCEPSAQAIGSAPREVAVQAKLTGLRGGTTYHFRLVARKGARVLAGLDEQASTPTVPVIAGGEAANVTSSSAELRATVDPEGLQVQSCTFEYGATTAYGLTAPCRPDVQHIGAGTEPVPVSATIEELEPNTTYHWRLSLTDKNGEAYGADHTFVYTTGEVELPDNRAYEMVTPPYKNGALIGDTPSALKYNIAEDGLRVNAVTVQCFAGSESCGGVRGNTGGGEPFDFTRTAGGWETSALAPPSNVFSANTLWMLGANEGNALFSMPTGSVGQDEWYARQPDGTFADIGPLSYTGAQAGYQVDKAEGYVATTDLSHLVWELEGTPAERWPFDQTLGKGPSLYEYSGTGNREPLLVGVTGGQGSTELVSDCGTEVGTGGGYAVARPHQGGDLSADGRTVFFTAAPCAGGSGANEHIPVPAEELYARVDGELEPEEARKLGLPEAHTIPISQPECEDAECRESEAHPSDAFFDGASEDASRVFFLDTQQLTDQSIQGTGTAGSNHCDESDCNLYLYDFAQPEAHNLIDVSEGHTGFSEAPAVQGVMAVSADGSHVYFVAKGVLTHTPNGQGQTARPGENNLYVFELTCPGGEATCADPERRTVFIATLPPSDELNWEGKTDTNVTPDGRFLVFESHGDLTPDAHAGGAQIYRYDAATETLVRISIGDDGFNDNGNGGAGAASIVGPQPSTAAAGPPRGDPTMSDDGSYVFFQSPVGLTPHARNDFIAGYPQKEFPEGSGKFINTSTVLYAQNVYEYHEGHVYLISDGRDVSVGEVPCGSGGDPLKSAGEGNGSAVCLLGSDASGHNVFFTTADQLVHKDTDTQVDIYDARVCEPENGNPCIAEPAPPLPRCGNEEACHGIPAATPSLLAPGTASFNGQGNLTATPAVAKKVTKKTTTCKRGYVKKKVKKKELCVKKKSDKKAKKSAHKSAKGRK